MSNSIVAEPFLFQPAIDKYVAQGDPAMVFLAYDLDYDLLVDFLGDDAWMFMTDASLTARSKNMTKYIVAAQGGEQGLESGDGSDSAGGKQEKSVS
jgi:hypothetical protein